MKPNPLLRGYDPKRPAFLILEQDGNWATFDGTPSGQKALLIFTSPDKAATFFKAQGSGRAQAVEILSKGVPSVIELCRQQGVTEFVVDLDPEAGTTAGEPVAELARYKQPQR